VNDVCIGLGYVLHRTQGIRSAKQTLVNALSIDPNNADAHYILGTIAREAKDLEAAEAHLRRAIQFQSDESGWRQRTPIS
jgi:Tfp pilus assembly protein PilF